MVKLILAIFCSLSIFADNPKTIFLISLTSLHHAKKIQPATQKKLQRRDFSLLPMMLITDHEPSCPLRLRHSPSLFPTRAPVKKEQESRT
ncbi:hypothetical protein BDE02_03G147500 [Populus trichocarpa]|nr:hypothetical protein BDE02_03G147500 [Populus trichocarpa]